MAYAPWTERWKKIKDSKTETSTKQKQLSSAHGSEVNLSDQTNERHAGSLIRYFMLFWYGVWYMHSIKTLMTENWDKSTIYDTIINISLIITCLIFITHVIFYYTFYLYNTFYVLVM